jgi:signal transduction histidine kinase
MRWIFDRGFPVHDEQGRLTYMTGIAEDITERKAADEMRRVRDLVAHLQSAREDERKRIAREIHDELCQTLTGIKLEVDWAVQRCRKEPERVHERLSQLADIIDQAFVSLRRISADLRPEALDSGLLNAVRWQADELQRTASLDCNLELPDDEIDLESRQSTAMFRILQEALTNVVRHAGARSVDIRVHQDAEQVVLEVSDDGCGITDDATQNPGTFGLLGMTERARLAGGTLSVQGRPGGGTTVIARLPLEPPA